MSYKVRRYGWRPQLPDHRDIPYTDIPKIATALPSKVSLRVAMPPVYDQGQLGSCTANALAAQLDYMRHLQGEKFITPSRLFIYYNERVIENTVNSDSGANARDGLKSLKSQGVCPESEWKYTISKFTTKPTTPCYTNGLKYEELTYKSVGHKDLTGIKSALANNLPVSFGFTVYSSFESQAVADSGIVPMPSQSEVVEGGHETLLVGYDYGKQMFEFRNSWGKSWGDEGYFWMPYEYVQSSLCSDFWVIDKVK